MVDRNWCKNCRSVRIRRGLWLCVGCAGRLRESPIEPIQTVQLPEGLDKDTIHSYGPDSFNLHRGFPVPIPGLVLGLVGPRSIGKTTALHVLAGRLKPNLGRFNDPPDWPEILTHFHEPYLKSYFTKIVEEKLKVVFKPQHFQDLRGQMILVGELLESLNQRDMMEEICDALELNKFLDVRLHTLSPGVLHRVIIATVALQKADVYIFDEMSNFLDASQRFKAAKLIRSLATLDSYVIVVENDLSVIDYMSDYIFLLYGEPKACGVVAQRGWGVRAGINFFLSGFDPKEKRRIRGEEMRFEVARTANYEHYHEYFASFRSYNYPDMSVSHSASHVKLEVTGGGFTDCQILLVLGESGTGKSTFLQMLPLQIDPLLDRQVGLLSPGEWQMVAIPLCLAKNAQMFLIDEPCAYLDADERIRAAMAIRRHILRIKGAAVIVEHDFLMSAYLADQVILVEATPSSTKFAASPPYPLYRGLNLFLEKLDITVQRDPRSFRSTPRVNKLGSIEDKDQKRAGKYYDVS